MATAGWLMEAHSISRWRDFNHCQGGRAGVKKTGDQSIVLPSLACATRRMKNAMRRHVSSGLSQVFRVSICGPT